jgi:hypothetical protein
MKLKFNIALVFILFCSMLHAQVPTQTIKGTIIDKDTRQPLIGAAVTLLSLEVPTGTVTDIDGKFELADVPVGRHQLRFEYLGYEAYQIEDAIVNSAKILVLDIALSEAAIVTDEVVVTARKRGGEALNEAAIVSTRSFSVEETQRYAASANDPSRMALGFPGVQGNRDGRSDIVIRGNAALGMGWRLEGIDIPNPNHFARRGSSGGGITIFSVSMLSNSDFSTGAFPAEYGNALSGVFDITFRNGNTEQREYTIRAGMLGLDFSTEGPIKKGKSSYLVNYRYSTLGILDAMDIRLVSERQSSNFQDISFKLNFNSDNGKHITSVWGIGGLSDEFEEVLEGVENWQTYNDYRTRELDSDMGAIGVNHNYLIDNTSYLRTGVAIMGQKLLFQNDTLDTGMKSTLVNDQLYVNSRLVLTSYLNKKMGNTATARLGVIASVLRYDLFYKYLLDDAFRTYINEEDNTYLIQPYLSSRIRLHPQLSLNAGLHVMYLGLNESTALDPRLGLSYQMNETASLNLAYGLHSRMVPLGTYFALIPDTEGVNQQPNLDLSFMRAHHLVLSYNQLFGESMRLRMEAYYQRLFNIPVSTDEESTYSLLNHNDGYPTLALVNEGTGTNYGLDITFEQFFNKGVFFIAAASIFNSTYEPLNGETYDTRYNSGFSASFMGGKEWSVGKRSTLQTGLRVLYSGGQRISPILANERNPFDPERPILDETNPFSIQVGDYFRPDLRIALRKDNIGTAWYLALDVQNFLSIKNDDPLAYDFDPNLGEWVYGFQSGIVPVLSYQLDF